MAEEQKKETEKEQEKQQLRKKFEKYAKSVGIKLNPDDKIVDGLLNSMILKKEKEGEYYCPCRMLQHNDKDKEIICPCVYHRGEIELQGHCHCRLFSK